MKDNHFKNIRVVLFLLMAGAFLIRLASIFYLSNFHTVTGYENEIIALNILSGQGYSYPRFQILEPTAFMYPLYTYFLAGHFYLFGHQWLPVELSQAVIDTVGVLLVFLLGNRLFGGRTAIFASMLYAVYPFHIYWCSQGQSVIISAVLLLSLTLAWHHAMIEKRMKYLVLTGIVLGLSILTKTLYFAFFPGFVLWTKLYLKESWLKTIIFSIKILFFAALVVSPWTVRNVLVLDRFILVTDNTGYNLWLGNNPKASGGLYSPDGIPVSKMVGTDLQSAVRGAVDSPGRDDVFRKAAVEYIRTNPGRFFSMIPARLRALWFFDPYMPSRFGPYRAMVYLPLAGIALLGMFLARSRFRELGIFYLMYLTMTAVYSVFFGQSRFRLVLEWSLVLFAAHAIALLTRGKDEGRARIATP